MRSSCGFTWRVMGSWDPFEREGGYAEMLGIVHMGATFDLHEAADAHRALDRHHLGKIALRVR